MNGSAKKQNKNAIVLDDSFVEAVISETARDRRRSKTAHDRLQSLYTVYGLTADRKAYSTVNSHAILKLKKSNTIAVSNRDNGHLMDELMMAKTSLNNLQAEKRVLLGRVRALEEEIMNRDRKYEDLFNNSISINEQQSTQAYLIKLRNAETLTRNLKRALRDKDAELKSSKQELSQIKASIKYTRVAELEVELKSHFQEIIRLKRLLEHYRVGSSQIEGEISAKDIKKLMEAYQQQMSSDGDLSTTSVSNSQDQDEPMQRVVAQYEEQIEELKESHKRILEQINDEWREKLEEKSKEESTFGDREELERDLEESRGIVSELTKQKIMLDQTITQLRIKEDISNKTISELQQQIKALVEDQEQREEARSIAESQSSRKSSFIHGKLSIQTPRTPNVGPSQISTPIDENSPTVFFSPGIGEASNDSTVQTMSAIKTSRKRPSIVTATL